MIDVLHLFETLGTVGEVDALSRVCVDGFCVAYDCVLPKTTLECLIALHLPEKTRTLFHFLLLIRLFLRDYSAIPARKGRLGRLGSLLLLLAGSLREEGVHEVVVDEVVEASEEATVLVRLLLGRLLLVDAEVQSEWVEAEVHLN